MKNNQKSRWTTRMHCGNSGSGIATKQNRWMCKLIKWHGKNIVSDIINKDGQE